MRRGLILALILGLSACAAPVPQDPFAPIVATPLDAVPEAVAPPDPPATPPADSPSQPGVAPPVAEPPPPPEPPALVNQRRDCQRNGGQLSARLPGVYACVRPTPDAGRTCTASADCAGLCLARSGTCAPLQPLFGCHEVFTSPGRRETLCTD